MSRYPPVSPRAELPEEFRFLCMLHNLGATTPERSITIEEISKWTSKDAFTVQHHLKKLMELGYVQSCKKDEADKYHVSIMGIRKVLTLYS